MPEELRAALRLGWEWLSVAFGAFVGFVVIGAFSLYTVGAWAVPGAILGGLLVGAFQKPLLASYGLLPAGRWWVTTCGTWVLFVLGAGLCLWVLQPAVPDLSSAAGLLALAGPACVAGALPAAVFQAWRLTSAPETRRAWMLWTALVLVVCGCLVAVLARLGHPYLGLALAAALYAGAFVLAVRVRVRF